MGVDVDRHEVVDIGQLRHFSLRRGSVRYINAILQDKMLFGSDWPVVTPDRWMADFAKPEIRDEIRPKVLKANPRRLLGA